ncbi:Pentatricopeptide repeat domain containing protein 3 mitochondrial [Dissostichus eleginoides]|uniref:Small ribosomal subunit protein mS39 n=1 Tax=Dissostichus eleginoides TaxID=100907 RepID=A0AAD9F3K2_DISEL|nr:Pentatricopeptide repeat domain containing protein 3 mitochondrial [Dissostichus eleginoides]
MVSPSRKPSVSNNMAAPGRHVGHYIQRNSRVLLNNFEQLWSHRNFGWTSALRQQAAEANKEPTDTIVIPRKKTWSKEAVLEALSSTVGRDPTAYPYNFQDDPFLSPRTVNEFKLYSLSKESGTSAAKFFINNNPKYFTTDFAEPHIPCLMPETLSLLLEDVSEEALKERVSLRKVTAAVEMYDQLLQSGTAVSMETTYDLLDLICLYCDRDPTEEGEPQSEDMEEPGEEFSWKENNNAERIFNLLPERDTRCYSALRGMVKVRTLTAGGGTEPHAKAFSIYTDLLNNRLTADVHIFNALLTAAPDVRDKYNERWDLLAELLNQMSQQKVQPNLSTFNSVLKALRRCGSLAKTQAIRTLNEMKAMGIAPSLASYDHILNAFSKAGSDVRVEGRSFTCQDPNDVLFFSTAMRICLNNKDLELGYWVYNLVEHGENWRLLGPLYQQGSFYRCFFNLLCMMEHIDVVLTWYRKLVPSLYYPNTQVLKDLLQALDTDSRLDLLPTIWKDIRALGHDNKTDLVEELLKLMARDKHSAENTSEADGRKKPMEWSTNSLSNITSLLLETLKLFKSKNRVPKERLLEDFLSVCCSDGSSQRAVELVQLSAAFCLSATPKLAKRTLAEAVLSELESTGESSG